MEQILQAYWITGNDSWNSLMRYCENYLCLEQTIELGLSTRFVIRVLKHAFIHELRDYSTGPC